MLSVVKMPLKGEIGGQALNSHGKYIVDHGKSWKNQGIVFLNFCGNPNLCMKSLFLYMHAQLSSEQDIVCTSSRGLNETA